jgi:hypothetical protein
MLTFNKFKDDIWFLIVDANIVAKLILEWSWTRVISLLQILEQFISNNTDLALLPVHNTSKHAPQTWSEAI